MHEETCLVSIVVPVYNTEEFVVECIESVMRQTDRSWELILVDDGSTDNSGRICDEYALKDGRIRVIHKPNTGLIETRLAGIGAARGLYCTGLDSDDYIDEDCIERIKRVANSGNYDIIAWNIRCIEDGIAVTQSFGPRYGVYSNNEFLLEVVKLSNHSVCNKAIKTELLRSIDYSLIPKHILDGEDYMLTIPPICCARSIYWMDDTLYNYRQLRSAISNQLSADRIIEYFESSMTIRKYISKYGMLTDELIYHDDLVVMELFVLVIKHIYKKDTLSRTEISKIKGHPFYKMMKRNEHKKNLTFDQFFVLKLFRLGLYPVLSMYYSKCAK